MSPAQWNARAAQAALCNSALVPGVQEWPHRLAQIPSRTFLRVRGVRLHKTIPRFVAYHDPNKSVADGSCF
jgi:hypothetical protein